MTLALSRELEKLVFGLSYIYKVEVALMDMNKEYQNPVRIIELRSVMCNGTAVSK